MWRILKLLGILAVALIGVLAIAFAATFSISESRLNKTFQVDPGSVPVLSDPETIAEGERLAIIRGCTDCHGSDLGGKVVIDDPAVGMIFATNLTSGEGGVGPDYTEIDYLRAIRHGVNPEGRGLVIMPSTEYFVLSDEDTGALIAYLISLPPVDRTQPEPKISPLGRVLITLRQLPPLAAEIIDHTAPRPAAPQRVANEEFGAYLVTSCMGCHGPNLAGGPVPGSPPEAPQAANLTPAGNPGNWTEEEFIKAMKTGVTPEGQTLDPKVMPWPIANAMTEVELQALWAYISNLKPVQ